MTDTWTLPVVPALERENASLREQNNRLAREVERLGMQLRDLATRHAALLDAYNEAMAGLRMPAPRGVYGPPAGQPGPYSDDAKCTCPVYPYGGQRVENPKCPEHRRRCSCLPLRVDIDCEIHGDAERWARVDK